MAMSAIDKRIALQTHNLNKAIAKKRAYRSPKKMVLRSAKGYTYVAQRSPREISHSGHGQNWEESERAGRQSIMRRSSEKVPEYSYSLIIGNRDFTKDCGWELRALASFARQKQPITVIYAKDESGLYYITDFTYEITMRNERTNEPTRATAEITLRKATKESIKTGTVKKKKPVKKPSKKKPSKKKPSKKKKVVKYKVKKGDTLWEISRKYYKTPLKWRKIADRNKVKNPRLLQIGKVLVIP